VWENLDRGELPYSVHRTRAIDLQKIGAKPTRGAENVVVDGCANSGLSGPVELGPYFQLLDVLEIAYNLLPIRYCCGLSILGKATPAPAFFKISRTPSFVTLILVFSRTSREAL